MSGRTVPSAARLSRTDLAFLRRAAEGLIGPGETVVRNDELRTAGRLSPTFVTYFLRGVGRVARITEEGRRALAGRR